MTDFDPTDPWGQKSPWDEAQPNTPTTTAPEAPVTNQPASVSPNPFKIGFTLKAASGYDAEWLTPTVYGSTAEETAQRGKDLLMAMKANGLIEFASQAAQFTRGQYLGGAGKPAAAQASAAQPTFQNGQVQYQQQAAQPPFGAGPTAPASAGGRPANVPDGWSYKEGTSKSGKPYKGWFPPRGVEASPIWT